MKSKFNQRIKRYTITLTPYELGRITAMLKIESKNMPEELSEEARLISRTLIIGGTLNL